MSDLNAPQIDKIQAGTSCEVQPGFDTAPTIAPAFSPAFEIRGQWPVFMMAAAAKRAALSSFRQVLTEMKEHTRHAGG